MEIKLWTSVSTLALLGSLTLIIAESSDSKQKNDESESMLARTANLDDFDLDLAAEESMYDLSGAPSDAEPRFKMPFSYAFNGGKPFSLEKDPITGKIDFNKAPPLKALNYTQQFNNDDNSKDYEKKNFERQDETDVEPNEINPYSSLHVFFNLPAHYSSDRYDNTFPLISSSYANTKVQSGANSYSISNHRPYHDANITPFYVPSRKVFAPKSSSTSTSTTTSTTMPTTTKSVTVTTPKSTTEKKKTVPTASTTITSTTTTTPRTTTSTTTTTVTPKTDKYTSMMDELDRVMSPSTTAEVKATTWKPSNKVINRYDDYANSVPKEPSQSTQSQKIQGSEEMPSSSKAPSVVDEYDGYEDYEASQEDDYNRRTSNTPASSVSSTEEDNSKFTSTANSVTSTSVAPTVVPEHSMEEERKNLSVKSDHNSQQVVTSMPIESSDNMFDSMNRDNVIQGHRPDFNMAAGHVRFPPNGGFDRPIPVESTSNIIVRPDQDMVSFVLGNRQNVEDVYYTHGTAVGENIYEDGGSFKPLSSSFGNGNNYQTIMTGQVDHSSVGLPSISVESAFNYQPERWYQQQPPKLVSNEVNESEKPNISVNYNGPVMQQQQPSDKVDDSKEDNKNSFVSLSNGNKHQDNSRPVEEHVVVINEADGSVQEFTSSTVPPRGQPENPNIGKDLMAPHRVGPNPGLPQLAENLTPPERPKTSGPSQRPPFYYHYRPVGTSRPEFNRPQKIPIPPPPRTKPNIQEPLNFKRRPMPQDSKLPNILPQFRPNSKASHGHRNPDIIGTLPAPQPYGNRRAPPPPSPPHSHIARRPTGPPSLLQRLNPPPLPASGMHNIRLPSTSREDTSSQNSDIIPNRFRQPSMIVSVRDDDRNRFQLSKQKLRLEDDQSERFSIEPPQIPPRPVLYPKHRINDHIPRVATLQMIQQRGGLDSEIEPLSNSTDTENNIESGHRNSTVDDETKNEQSEKAPVYVVYPVNTALNIGQEESPDKDETVVVGTRGPHRPLPPDTLQKEEDVQKETSDKKFPMMVLPVRPHQHTSPPVIASDFPYPLERPDPALLNQQNAVREKPILTPKDPDSNKHASIEEDNNNDNTNVNVIPYLQDFVPFAAKKNHISATLQKLPSSTPIAYVFTPTAQTLTHRADVINKDDDEKPVLLPSQQPSSSSSSAPSPQNFMAPFVASMSVEAPAKNGWSVVVVNSGDDKNSTEEKKSEMALTAEDTQTERNDFDPENFKPQLFGGFQPIYEFPTENQNDEIVVRPADASADMPRSIRKK